MIRGHIVLFHLFFCAYYTNGAISNDTKVNDLVTLAATFMFKKGFSDFVAARLIDFHTKISCLFYCAYKCCNSNKSMQMS